MMVLEKRPEEKLYQKYLMKEKTIKQRQFARIDWFTYTQRV